MLKRVLPPFHHLRAGEAGDTGNTVQIWSKKVALLEEVVLQMDTSSIMPFQFTRPSRSLSEWSLLPEHQWDHSITPNDQMCYCIYKRVTLAEGRGDQPPPSHVWSGLLIDDILQESCSKDWKTEAIVLSLDEAILFFGRCSCNRWLLYRKVKDTELGLRGLFNWARKPVQIEATINTMQEGHQAIADAVMEWELRSGGQDTPEEWQKQPRPLPAAYNIEEWMWGLREAPSGEVRNGDVGNHGLEQRSAHSQCVGWSSRQHKWQERPWFPRDPYGCSPSSGDGSSNWGSNQSSQQLTMMRMSRESNQSVWAGRVLGWRLTCWSSRMKRPNML